MTDFLSGIFDTKRIYVTLFAVLSILSLLFIPTISVAQNAFTGKSEKEKPKKLSKEEYERKVIENILAQIETLFAKVPPDYKGMADLYMILFQEFSRTTQGKMSAWEAYELYRKAKKWDLATASLMSIMSVYGYQETMDNPLDMNQPVTLRATARVEMGRLYAEKGDFLTAIEIARSVPNQYPGVIVGMFSGEKTYYGRVEVICALDSANYAERTNKHNQAILLLLDLLRGYPEEKIGKLHGSENVQSAIVKLTRKIVTAMPAANVKKIMTYQELEDLCNDRLALARILLYKAEVFKDSYKKPYSNQQKIEDALILYGNLLKRYPEVIDHAPKGMMPLSVVAIRHIRELFAEKKKDNDRALYELSTIANHYRKKGDPPSRTIAAYALYYSGMIHYKLMKNPQQAAYDFEILLKTYPEVWEYPSPKTAEKKPKLADYVKKVLKRANEERY